MPNFTTKNGTKLFYTRTKGKTPTLLFIHGLGANHTVWDKFLKKLAQFSTVTVDLQGHGKSESTLNCNPAQLREEVTQLITHLKITNYIAIGHSFGGIVAAELARNKTKGLKGIVLISSPTSKRDLKPLFLLELQIAKLIPQKIYKLLDTTKSYADTPNKVLYCIKCLAENHVQSTHDILGQFTNYSMKKTTTPTLAIVSKRDEVVRNGLLTLFPDAVQIKGRHLAYLRQTELITKLIREFIHFVHN